MRKIGFILIILMQVACQKKVISTQESESENLLNLKNEIVKLSESQTCNESANWRFTALGSKACGGPLSYIAYSVKIDTADFLKKVANYNNLQNEFNKKWGIISDCSYLLPPDSVVCENGKPVLK